MLVVIPCTRTLSMYRKRVAWSLESLLWTLNLFKKFTMLLIKWWSGIRQELVGHWGSQRSSKTTEVWSFQFMTLLATYSELSIVAPSKLILWRFVLSLTLLNFTDDESWNLTDPRESTRSGAESHFKFRPVVLPNLRWAHYKVVIYAVWWCCLGTEWLIIFTTASSVKENSTCSHGSPCETPDALDTINFS